MHEFRENSKVQDWMTATLVIDRSMEPQNDKIAVCCIDGEFTVKRLKVVKDASFNRTKISANKK